jgi:hypothetical protein
MAESTFKQFQEEYPNDAGLYPLPSLSTNVPSFFRWPSGGQGASIHAMAGRYHPLIARSAATSRSEGQPMG